MGRSDLKAWRCNKFSQRCGQQGAVTGVTEQQQGQYALSSKAAFVLNRANEGTVEGY